MRKHMAKVFVLLTQIVLVVAVVCLIVSISGKNWVENVEDKFATKVNFGLTSFCRESGCEDRLNVMQFKDEDFAVRPLTSYDFDLIMLLLIISIVFSVIAILVSMFLCCTVNGRKRWRIISVVVAVMALIAVVACLVGIAYFEGKIGAEEITFSYKHGWTSIIAWLGFGLLVVDTVLLVVVSCVKPDDHSKKPHSVRSTASYASSNTQETWASSRQNKGFEFVDVQKDAFYVGKDQRSRREPAAKVDSKNMTSRTDDDRYGSPRGSNNLAYQSDHRSNEVVYDPRNRSSESHNNRRKRSFELAYSQPPPPRRTEDDSRRQTYSSGYPNSSEQDSRRQTKSSENDSRRQTGSSAYDSRRQTDSPEHIPRKQSDNYERDPRRQKTTTGYDPRRKSSSPYDTSAGSGARYTPSNRTSRSARYPTMDTEGYEVR